MLGLIAAGITCTCILKLQIVRLRKVNTLTSQCSGVLLLISLTNHEVHMVQSDSTVVCQGILNQGICVLTVSLGQTFILLGEIYTVTLNPRGSPSLVVSMGCAVREVDLIGQLVILALYTQHFQQVDISRTSSYETVNSSLLTQQIINEQRVHGRDITMYRVIIHAITVSVVFPAACRTYHVIEYPCGLVVSLDSRLHTKYTTEHVTKITIQTLDIAVVITDREHILIRVRIYETGAELDELSIHRVVHTSCVTAEVRA